MRLRSAPCVPSTRCRQREVRRAGSWRVGPADPSRLQDVLLRLRPRSQDGFPRQEPARAVPCLPRQPCHCCDSSLPARAGCDSLSPEPATVGSWFDTRTCGVLMVCIATGTMSAVIAGLIGLWAHNLLPCSYIALATGTLLWVSFGLDALYRGKRFQILGPSRAGDAT